jgi:hypothetical protein
MLLVHEGGSGDDIRIAGAAGVGRSVLRGVDRGRGTVSEVIRMHTVLQV